MLSKTLRTLAAVAEVGPAIQSVVSDRSPFLAIADVATLEQEASSGDTLGCKDIPAHEAPQYRQVTERRRTIKRDADEVLPMPIQPLAEGLQVLFGMPKIVIVDCNPHWPTFERWSDAATRSPPTLLPPTPEKPRVSDSPQQEAPCPRGCELPLRTWSRQDRQPRKELPWGGVQGCSLRRSHEGPALSSNQRNRN